jgi:hypothetical protein
MKKGIAIGVVALVAVVAAMKWGSKLPLVGTLFV